VIDGSFMDTLVEPDEFIVLSFRKGRLVDIDASRHVNRVSDALMERSSALSERGESVCGIDKVGVGLIPWFGL